MWSDDILVNYFAVLCSSMVCYTFMWKTDLLLGHFALQWNFIHEKVLAWLAGLARNVITWINASLVGLVQHHVTRIMANLAGSVVMW